MNFIRKYFLHSPVRYIAATVAATAFMLVRAITLGGTRLAWGDGASVGGIIVFFFGLLVLVNDLGSFDGISYGFSVFQKNRRYKDYFSYVEAKKESRKGAIRNFVPYVVVGVVFFIVSLIIGW